MTAHAAGNFEVKGWDEKTWDGKPSHDVKGAKLTHAIVTQAFTGDITGEGMVQFLMSYREDGTATFVGLQRIVGSIGKRSGSFALTVNGTFDGGAAQSTWSVVPGSGTEELKGIRGKGDSIAQHGQSTPPYALDYDFE